MSFIIALFDHVSRRLRPNAGKQGDARRNKNTRHFTLRLLWSLDPTPRRTSKPALTSSCPRHPRPGPAATPSTRSRRRTPRTRGSNCHGRATTEDTCYLGFADTTLLDFVSRGLDARELEDKRVGDFDPSHRIAVFTEPESESSSKTNGHGHGDSSDEEDDSYVPDMRPRWVSVVSQLDVLDLMVQDPDLLGTFPENRDDGVAGVDARGLLGGGGDVRLFRRRVFRVDAQLKGERGGGAGQTRSVHDRVDIGVGCQTSDVRERPGGRVDVDRR